MLCGKTVYIRIACVGNDMVEWQLGHHRKYRMQCNVPSLCGEPSILVSSDLELSLVFVLFTSILSLSGISILTRSIYRIDTE